MSTLRTALRDRGGGLVLIGGSEWRRAAMERVRAEAPPEACVLAAPAPDRVLEPWEGVARVVEMFADDLVRLAPMHAASLRAACAGSVVGDHVGLGADLRGLIVASALKRPGVILVPDAHLLDLASAAALSFACAGLAGPDLSVVALQAPSTRGVVGFTVVDAEAPTDSVPDVGHALPDRRARLRAASPLDAADAHEQVGEWADAARLWLVGGRPDRARRALSYADDSPLATEVRARLTLTTESMSGGIGQVVTAAAALADRRPAVAARLRALVVSGLLNRGDIDGASELVRRARQDLERVRSCAEVDTAAELVDVAAQMVAVSRGGAVGPSLESSDRPLVRLAEGRVDDDLVRVLTSLAMPLAWRGALDDARSLLDRVNELLERRRALAPMALPLALSAWLARRQGMLDRALAEGTLAIDIAHATGAVNDRRFAVAEVAHIEAMQGRLESCRQHVAELVPPGKAAHGPAQLGAVSALAVAELLDGNPERAIEVLEPVHASFSASVGPAQVAWRHNLIEAYVLCDRREDAQRVLADLESWVSEDSSDRVRGQLARARGLLEPHDHAPHLQRAMDLLVDHPTLRWRTGQQLLRRLLEDGRRAEAEPLAERLLSEATASGGAGGVEHLRRLLTAHGMPPPPSAAPNAATLSVEHLRIALLLADGLDDEAIAAQLRLGVLMVRIARHRILELLHLDDVRGLRDRITPGEHANAAVEVCLFGRCTVTRGGQRLVPPSGLPTTLLALVALRRVVHVEVVLDALWPDAAVDEARPRLRNVLTRLRATLGSVVVRDGEQLRLADGVMVDLHRFETLAAATQSVDDPSAPGQGCRINAALEVWAGEPLEAWRYEEWAMADIERLRRVRDDLAARRGRAAS